MNSNITRLRSGLGLVIVSLFILAMGFTSCGDDVDPAEKKITSFVFLLTENPINVNVIAQIDESAKTITAIMPEGTDVNGLIPSIEVSSGATVSPTTAQNFNNPVTYTVTGSDGSTTTYTATVTAALSQREILQLILDENPGNTLGWLIPNSGDLDVLEGVTTNINGDIVELDLEVEGLTRLPAEIGQLSTLQSLDLSNNNLNSIPREIGQLTNLTFLDLRSTQLTSLPSEIGQLIALQELLLNGNNLGQLPPSIGDLSNLVVLEAQGCSLSSLPAEIVQLSNLRELFLAVNQFSTLPSEIIQLTGLSSLGLSSNQLTSIPKEIGQLTSLRLLNLRSNQLTSIPPEIGFLFELLTLSLSENNLTSIPRAICNLEEFHGININHDPSADCVIPPTEMDALISIYSSNPNNTLGWGVDNFPGVIFTSGGSPLNITANNRNLVRIPDGIDGLTSLEDLNVSDNALGTINSAIGDINTLTKLTMHNTGIFLVQSELGQLSNLTQLIITSNPIINIAQEVCDLQVSNGGILTIVTDPGEGCD